MERVARQRFRGRLHAGQFSACHGFEPCRPCKSRRSAVFPDIKLETAELNRGNLLLYSLLSNSRFMSWAEDYHAELVKRATAATEIEDDEEALRAFLAVTDRSTILSDLAAGVAKNRRFGTAFGERNSHALHEAERVVQTARRGWRGCSPSG